MNAEPQRSRDRVSARRNAADALIIGGLTVVWGSFSTWGACSKEPCEGDGGLLHIYERAGVDVGAGVVTAILGVLLAALGVYALLNLERVVRPGFALVAAASVLASICIHLIRIYVVDDDDGFLGFPYLGLLVTAVGGLIALAAAARQWQIRKSEHRPVGRGMQHRL